MAASATAGAAATTWTTSSTAARPAAAAGATGAWAAGGAATATRAAATRAAAATTTAGETATAEGCRCADVAASDSSIEFNGSDPAVLVQHLDALPILALQVRIQNFSPQMCGSDDLVEGLDVATAVEVVDAILFKAIAKAVIESGCRSTRQQCRTRHEERC